MAGTLTPNEEAQLAQTIEMFEVITQSQPLDYQSLEILKEAYFKLGRHKDVVGTSKRIAQAYVHLGQLSSAILEYESILQRFPDDPDVQAALAEIESRASSLSTPSAAPESEPVERVVADDEKLAPAQKLDDGRAMMEKIFVEGRLISKVDFDDNWTTVEPGEFTERLIEPFVYLLADRGLVPAERSLRLLCERSRLPLLPVARYDVDVDLARSFPRDLCLRWCVLPFDRMSRTVQIATANPFNKQAALELEASTRGRTLWYLAPADDLVRTIRRIIR